MAQISWLKNDVYNLFICVFEEDILNFLLFSILKGNVVDKLFATIQQPLMSLLSLNCFEKWSQNTTEVIEIHTIYRTVSEYYFSGFCGIPLGNN